jgi:hypothetical protein
MAISITCIDTLHYTPTIEALKRTIKTLGDKVTEGLLVFRYRFNRRCWSACNMGYYTER